MTAATDLSTAAALCNEAASAALTQLGGLGPKPANPADAAVWEHNDEMLTAKISILTNLSSTLSALAVTAGLDAVWPELMGLEDVTAEAKHSIEQIAAISSALSKLAAVVDFGVSLVALVTTPSVAAAQAAVDAFNKI